MLAGQKGLRRHDGHAALLAGITHAFLRAGLGLVFVIVHGMDNGFGTVQRSGNVFVFSYGRVFAPAREGGRGFVALVQDAAEIGE